MELKEMIKVMQHYENGGEVECSLKGKDSWKTFSSYCWDWFAMDYRIKESKQEVTIEKWLCSGKKGEFTVVETSDINGYIYHKKVKLLKTYEIEL